MHQKTIHFDRNRQLHVRARNTYITKMCSFLGTNHLLNILFEIMILFKSMQNVIRKNMLPAWYVK